MYLINIYPLDLRIYEAMKARNYSKVTNIVPLGLRRESSKNSALYRGHPRYFAFLCVLKPKSLRLWLPEVFAS